MTATEQQISEVMRSLRSRVKPENCKRPIAVLRKAQKASVAARLANKQAREANP